VLRRPRPGRAVNRIDAELVRRVGKLPKTPMDRWLCQLTRSANHSKLWLVVAAVLAARPGATRRAALRGLAAIAGASATANLVGKNLFPRRRPAADLLPKHRSLFKRPVSSSFPSGHAASAAAFTVGVATEHPVAGALIAPVAGVIAYSRVHTGVHWPSDVAAGALLGTGVAFATRHWWPVRRELPARAMHRAEAPALPAGEGVVFLVNSRSGPSGVDPAEEIAAAWPKATVLSPADGEDPATALTEYLDGTDDEVRAVGVAGGDGTVATVVTIAVQRDLPLVLVPAGTLNHFARDVGVVSVADAVLACTEGRAVRVDLADVRITGQGDDEHRWFVNTASIGGYPEVVRLREALQRRWTKWTAGAYALIRTLRTAQPIPVELDGRQASVWMLFVGNGSYEPPGFAPVSRPALDTGTLDVRYLRADLPYSRARFVLATITRTLHTSHVYRRCEVSELDVTLPDGHKRVATDGEVGPVGNRFTFRSMPNALTVYRLHGPDL
jgi:undecaprenyl-diphosphatase